jgi:hypothetical protein
MISADTTSASSVAANTRLPELPAIVVSHWRTPVVGSKAANPTPVDA